VNINGCVFSAAVLELQRYFSLVRRSYWTSGEVLRNRSSIAADVFGKSLPGVVVEVGQGL